MLRQADYVEVGVKRWLITASILEAFVGMFLLVLPALLIRLLFNVEINKSGVLVGRFAAVCLISLSVGCWPNRAGVGAFLGMLTYNVLATVYFVCIGLNGEAGIMLWPVVVAHAGLAGVLIRVWRVRSFDGL